MGETRRSSYLVASPPTGTVTFLFTDIEGSTKLLEHDAEAMQKALARHDEILHCVTREHDGYVFKSVGDAFCCTFSTATDALEAALEAQRALLTKEGWPVETVPPRVRMALHAGLRRSGTATTSALRSTGWRGCSPLLTEVRCSSRWRPESSCATGCRPMLSCLTWGSTD